MPDLVTHLITGQSKVKGAGRSDVTVKCSDGTFSRNSAAPLPENLTAWSQDVTCPDCLEVPDGPLA